MSPMPDLEGRIRERCVSYVTLRRLSKKCNVAKNPMALAIWGPGHSVLSFIANRPSFLIGKLLLRQLSETVVVQGNAPHDRPCGLVGHLIGNCASFLCTKAPMVRVPETNFLQGITPISGRDVQAIFFRRRHQ